VSIPWLDESPEAWDTVQLGGFTLPGAADIDGDLEDKMDVKDAGGSDGASITIKGRQPAALTIVLRIWTRAQWKLFEPIFEQLYPTPGTIRKPYDIVHPKTKLARIKSVLIRKISLPKRSPDGLVTVTFTCLEFLLPSKKKVTSTPKHSTGFSNVLVNDPNTNKRSEYARPAKPSATLAAPDGKRKPRVITR